MLFVHPSKVYSIFWWMKERSLRANKRGPFWLLHWCLCFWMKKKIIFLKRLLFFLDMDHFWSLLWICYNIVSVIGFGFWPRGKTQSGFYYFYCKHLLFYVNIYYFYCSKCYIIQQMVIKFMDYLVPLFPLFI